MKEEKDIFYDGTAELAVFYDEKANLYHVREARPSSQKKGETYIGKWFTDRKVPRSMNYEMLKMCLEGDVAKVEEKKRPTKSESSIRFSAMEMLEILGED